MIVLDDKSTFLPVYVILVGTIILLANLGILPAGVDRFWPVIFIVPALIKLSTFGTKEKKD